MCEREFWRPNWTATYWPPLLWLSASLSRSTGLLNWRPGDPLCWMLAFSIASCHPTGLQTLWLPVFTELYNSSIAHSISLEWLVWSSSSGNNCHAVHQVHSMPVHQSYDCTMGFNLFPYCQPSPSTPFVPITAIGMCHFFRCIPLEWHLWPGRRSIYDIETDIIL